MNSIANTMDDAVIIALGSNLAGGYQSSRGLLEAAVARLHDSGLGVTRRSRWWRSAAWPDQSAPDYLNGVVFVETDRSPREVMSELLALEAAFGRRRTTANAPRTLDLDLIAYGRQVIEAPDLVVPHPRAADRLFVVGPLAEIAPAWTHPITGRTASDLAVHASIGIEAAPER
jgi:2-amino-4-hydroxy-6-hydroxymethyldihydropteridine diphosphokinase